MANRCTLEVYVPIEEIPDKQQKGQIKAYYEADRKWRETRGDRSAWKEYEEFLAAYPGVPSRRTQERYSFHDFNDFGDILDGIPVKNDPRIGQMKPESEQYNTPTISAEFLERDGQVYACIDEGLSYTIPGQKGLFGGPHVTTLEMRWWFKHSFPWWTQVGFAGGEKLFGKLELDEESEPRGWLMREQPIKAYLTNITKAISVYEQLPVSFELWEWLWAAKELTSLERAYSDVKLMGQAIPGALLQLDWSEVAFNVMSYEQIESDDYPNQIMQEISSMKELSGKLLRGEIEEEDFRQKYAARRYSTYNPEGYKKIEDREELFHE